MHHARHCGAFGEIGRCNQVSSRTHCSSRVSGDEIPADLAKANLRDDISFEEAIAPYLKRAGQDGVHLTKGGKRIVRFTEYDGACIVQDIIIAHDNVAEVAASKGQGADESKAPF